MAEPDAPRIADWIGRSETWDDLMPSFPAHALAALLDREPPRATLPLPWHWLYALATSGRTGEDGHPLRGGFLPPVALPRRMWAASEISITRPLSLAVPATRISTVAGIAEKPGRSGPLVFVTVDHAWRQDGIECLRERQTIVYRDDAATPAAPPPPGQVDQACHQRTLFPDSVTLFRYSALTYNAHRIHYDLPYATGVEGYPGLVVHGPLIATLLIDAAAPLIGDRPVARFAFRAERPAFAGEPLLLHAREEGPRIALWSSDAAGRTGMRAELDLVAPASEPSP